MIAHSRDDERSSFQKTPHFGDLLGLQRQKDRRFGDLLGLQRQKDRRFGDLFLL
jgi:hypothetical protein